MHTVIVSPEFQVVIPPDIRQALDIQPGQEVLLIQYENRLELIPVRPVQQARGVLRGIDTKVKREAERL